MAIKLPDPGNGIPEQKTGNDEWTNMKIVRDNFADQSNAASRLVGTADGQVATWQLGIIEGIEKDSKTNLLLKSGDTIPEDSAASRLVGSTRGRIPLADDIRGALYKTSSTSSGQNEVDANTLAQGTYTYILTGTNLPSKLSNYAVVDTRSRGSDITNIQFAYSGRQSTEDFSKGIFFRFEGRGTWGDWAQIYTDKNTTKDGNGFLKAASPVVDLYDDKIELNGDAETQRVKFIKNGTGDYTLKTKTGLRSDNTWRIEIPNDDNRNPLFAVDIDAQEDGTINIKCYKRIFSMETFLFGPDFNAPVDINEGRFISVRLNDNPEPEQTDEPAI